MNKQLVILSLISYYVVRRGLDSLIKFSEPYRSYRKLPGNSCDERISSLVILIQDYIRHIGYSAAR